jgi:hypothetical protein
MSAIEPQTLRDEYSQATKILDDDYNPASLDSVINVYENLHVEKKMETVPMSLQMMYSNR